MNSRFENLCVVDSNIESGISLLLMSKFRKKHRQKWRQH